MFKFNAGRIEHRMATLIGFGFEEYNLHRMKALDHPIYIMGSQIRITGANFCIFYAGTGPDTFEHRFNNAVEQINDTNGRPLIKPDESIQVIHNTDENFFVAPLPVGDEVIYAIGLTDKSMQTLRDGNTISYRVRLISGEGENYEVLMFWGPNAEMMEAQFADLIGPNTERLPK